MTTHESTFFDTLSDDALSVIVRHTGTHPYIDEWPEHVDSPNLLCLLKIGGRISYWARDVVSRLQQVKFDSKAPSSNAFEDFAPSLRSVRYFYRAEKTIPRPMLHLPNLRELRIDTFNTYNYERCPIHVVLGACGASLHTLALCLRHHVGSKEVDAITSKCFQLKEFELCANSFEEPELEPLWPVVGKTVTKLTLKALYTSFHDNIEVLEPIARNCVMVEEVEVNHPQNLWLYKRLGSNLKIMRLRFSDRILSMMELRSLFESCPNLLIRAAVFLEIIPKDIFVVLSSRFRSLVTFLSYPKLFPEMPMLQEISLHMTENQADTIESFSTHPIPTLRRLTLRNVATGVIFDKLAEAVTNLEELRISMESFSAPGLFDEHNCDRLLLANAKLRKVHTRIDFRDEECSPKAEQFIASMLKSVRDCKKLCEFKVLCRWLSNPPSPIIRDACVPLRSRGVSMIYSRF